MPIYHLSCFIWTHTISGNMPVACVWSLITLQPIFVMQMSIFDNIELQCTILSHRVPIFPCILRKQEFQYYHYYLDQVKWWILYLNKKSLKLMTLGNKFSKILGKYYETSFIHNSSFRSPWCNNIICMVTMQACAYQLLNAESGRGFCSSCDHDCSSKFMT